MTDSKMLQILIDGQASLKKGQDVLKEMLSKLDKRLTGRIDALGKQLNVLDEDAPTREELEELEGRVVTLEKRDAS